MLNEADLQAAVLLVEAHLADLVVATAAPADPAPGRAVATVVPQDQAVAQVMDAMEIMEAELIIVPLQSLSQAQESDTELTMVMVTTITTTAKETTDTTPITAITTKDITTTTTIKA